MTKYQNDVGNKGVSALDSALKLLMDIYKRIRFFIGCLLIDNALRYVLRWYDTRHPNSKRKDANNSEEIVLLKREIISLQKTNLELDNKIGIFQSKEKSLNHHIDTLLSDIRRKDEVISFLNDEKERIHSENTYLKNDNQKLLRRCLPDTEIPSFIYYAQGDASGSYLRKLSTVRTPEHIYRLVTFAGDTTSASFEPFVDSNIQELINNRALTLIACDIIRIEPNASSIQVCEAGKVKCENNKWKVTNKAKIILS